MSYIENPKTRGSGIVCCIPQKGRCPSGCADCFFQGGRSYLEPLEENTPNMPPDGAARGRVVRVNDGNDSANQYELVLRETARYPRRFYNTSSPDALVNYGAPVVLTVNPGKMTDKSFYPWATANVPDVTFVDTWTSTRNLRKATSEWFCSWVMSGAPSSVMFARVRTNTWNLERVVNPAVKWWTDRGVPVVLTFMAYHDKASMPWRQPLDGVPQYTRRKRTTNAYWAITSEAWRQVMARYQGNPLVYSCGTEGAPGGTLCRRCGNCLREYCATMERMRAG